VNNLRKIFTIVLLILFMSINPFASLAKDGFDLTSDSFLKRLSFAAARVPYGLSSDQIKQDIKISKSGDIILAYNTGLMLLVNQDNHSHNIKNIAVTFFYNDPEPDEKDIYHVSQNNETVFRNICMQVIFALHPSMKTAQAKEILNEIGIEGTIFDGLQRSKVVDNHLYIARLQPNGVAIMLVLHN